jgi:hypothetical protein
MIGAGDAMDWLTFFSSVIGSLVKIAWPAAVFGAVWIFRDKIEDLLPLLKLKYKDLDVSFRFDEAAKEAARLTIVESGESEPTPEEKSKFEELAEISPNAAILEYRGEIETLLQDIIDTKLPQQTSANVSKSSYRSRSMGEMTRILRNNNIIDSNTSALLDNLRAIGNQAAHRVVVFNRDDALKFRDLAEKTMSTLKAIKWFEPLPPETP